MQPDEVRIHDTREWIARSREDLDMAAFALTPKPPFLRDCLFHCQQAVEKVCKAFLTFHDESFTKTHNLIDLGLQCARAAPGACQRSRADECLRRPVSIPWRALSARGRGSHERVGLSPQARRRGSCLLAR